MIILILLGFLWLSYLIINYSLFSYGLYQMAKKKGIKKPGLAWIPIYNLYMLGLVAGNSVKVFGKTINNLSVIYLLSGILFSWTFLFNNIEHYSFFVVLFLIIHFVTMKKIFNDFNVSNPALISTITTIFSFMLPIVLFGVSFNDFNEDLNIIES